MWHEIDVPTVRTIIQSFDTARYHQDTPSDLKTDVAHARTEALMAILFGRTIVVPAGQVADSPAFIALFSEIMNAQRKVRAALYAKSSYRPFALGLESDFKDYDDFVAGYSESAAPLVAIDEQARRKGEARTAQLNLMRQAYLERDFRKLDEAHLGYGHFAELIATEFGKGSSSGAAVVTANRQRIYTGKPGGLAAPVKALIGKLERKGIGRAVVEEIKAALTAVEADLNQSAASPLLDAAGLRGSWYARQARFGSSWDIARIWLDHALFREFTVRYDVQIPSYFLQEITPQDYDVHLPLAFVGDSVVASMQKKLESSGPSISAAAEKVDWEALWEMVADPKFQQSLCTLNADLDSALLEELRTLESAKRDFADDPIALFQREERARKARQAKAGRAIDEHIDRMLASLRDYLVTNSAGRLVVALKRAPRTLLKQPLLRIIGRGAKEGAAESASGLVENEAAQNIQHYLAAPAGVEPARMISNVGVAASVGAGTATGAGAALAAAAARYTVDWVLRPKAFFGVPIDAVREQRHQVNFWLGAAHYSDS